MTEFTVSLETKPGVATDEGLRLVDLVLRNEPRAGGAAVIVDATDAYSTTFQVEAEDAALAALTALDIFVEALERGGILEGRPIIEGIEISITRNDTDTVAA